MGLIGRLRAWWRAPRMPARTVPCPYCANPDRDSVFDDWKGCLYDEKAAAAKGIVGGDPLCVCDGYPTEDQLSQLGMI